MRMRVWACLFGLVILVSLGHGIGAEWRVPIGVLSIVRYLDSFFKWMPCFEI
jgi:hypothetical protein